MNQELIDVLAVILNQLPGREITIPKGAHGIEGDTIMIDEDEDTMTIRLVNKETENE